MAVVVGFIPTEVGYRALEIARTGHRVFARLRDSEIPTFAFVNGAALGGGLELPPAGLLR